MPPSHKRPALATLVALASGLASTTQALSPIELHSNAQTLGLGKWDMEDWLVTNDSVMGGRSTSKAKAVDNDSALQFKGDLSTKGGGFSKIGRRWSPQHLDLSGKTFLTFETDALDSEASPLTLSVQFSDTSDSWWGYSYAAPFTLLPANAGWRGDTLESQQRQRFNVSVDSLVRQRRGKVGDSGSLDTSSIEEVSIYVLYQEGEFDLKFHALHAWTDAAEAEAWQNEQDDDWKFRKYAKTLWSADADVADALHAAVAHGAPLYNAGYHWMCAAHYRDVLAMIVNGAGVGLTASAIIDTALATAEAQDDDGTDRSWTLRAGIDKILHMVKDGNAVVVADAGHTDTHTPVKLVAPATGAGSDGPEWFDDIDEEGEIHVEVWDAIWSAIAEGAPLYNQGDKKGCVSVYQQGSQMVVDHLRPIKKDENGVSVGYVRAGVLGAARLEIQEHLDLVVNNKDLNTDSNNAWTLRAGFDKALSLIRSCAENPGACEEKWERLPSIEPAKPSKDETPEEAEEEETEEEIEEIESEAEAKAVEIAKASGDDKVVVTDGAGGAVEFADTGLEADLAAEDLGDGPDRKGKDPHMNMALSAAVGGLAVLAVGAVVFAGVVLRRKRQGSDDGILMAVGLPAMSLPALESIRIPSQFGGKGEF